LGLGKRKICGKNLKQKIRKEKKDKKKENKRVRMKLE
jgi:hypothetical protein